MKKLFSKKEKKKDQESSKVVARVHVQKPNYAFQNPPTTAHNVERQNRKIEFLFPLNELPDDLLNCILLELDVSSIGTIAQASKRFCMLTKRNTIWKAQLKQQGVTNLYDFEKEVPLHVVFKNRQIPFVVKILAEQIASDDGLKTEGIFRVSGASTEVNQFVEVFKMHRLWNNDALYGCDEAKQEIQKLFTSTKISSWTSVLKSFLREMQLLNQNLLTTKTEEQEALLQRDYLLKHNPSGFFLLQFVLQYFLQIANLSAMNKMGAVNMGIIGNSMLWTHFTSAPEALDLNKLEHGNKVTTWMIENCLTLFDLPIHPL